MYATSQLKMRVRLTSIHFMVAILFILRTLLYPNSHGIEKIWLVAVNLVAEIRFLQSIRTRFLLLIAFEDGTYFRFTSYLKGSQHYLL